MSYKYKNQFNITKEMKETLSELISIKETADIECEVLIINIPEHMGTVIEYIEGNPYDGQYHLLNGAQCMDLYENYSYESVGRIKEEEVQVFLVAERECVKKIKQTKISKRSELKELLNSLCEYWTEYNGILNIENLIKRFPYLKAFFNQIDKWREETGFVTVDKNILERGFQKVIK